MPSALPGISITQASALLQEQVRIIRSFPEVKTVFGTVGRSDSATDNAPLDMYDTTIMLKPQEQWRPGMTYEKLIREMDDKLQFPGLTNTWTMPVRNRLDMELTGIKTAVGLKVQGPDLARIQDVGAQIQKILARMPDTSSIFAERVSQGFYLKREKIVPNHAPKTTRISPGMIGKAKRLPPLVMATAILVTVFVVSPASIGNTLS